MLLCRCFIFSLCFEKIAVAYDPLFLSSTDDMMPTTVHLMKLEFFLSFFSDEILERNGDCAAEFVRQEGRPA